MSPYLICAANSTTNAPDRLHHANAVGELRDSDESYCEMLTAYIHELT